MPLLDITEFDFSQEHALGPGKIARRVAVVTNDDALAVLHVGVKSPVPWLDLYPAEFALAPSESLGLTWSFGPSEPGTPPWPQRRCRCSGSTKQSRPATPRVCRQTGKW